MSEQAKYDTLNSFVDNATIAVPQADTGVRRSVVTTTPLPQRGWIREHESIVIGLSAVVGFVIVWQSVAAARIMSRLFFPGPTDVWDAFGEWYTSGELGIDIATSGQEFLTGYILAALTAIPLGLVIGWYPRIRAALDPFITFFYATPRIVLIPLFIIWLGIGIESKVAVVYLGAFFAMVINTTAGVRSLDSSLLRVARSFGANDLTVFRTIALPGSVPFILTGLRLGIGHALVGVVVGEYIAAQHGVGRMMAIAGNTFQSSKVFAGLFIIAAAGLLLTYVLQRLERHFDAWRPQH